MIRMINRYFAFLMYANTTGLAAVVQKNPSPDENLLAQGVAPAINIPRGVLALHELKLNRRFGDVLNRGIAGRTR